MPDSTVPDVLVLQHVRAEPPDRITEALDASRLTHRTVRIFRGEPVPEALDGVRGLVVMGGPMGVSDVDARPHLRAELDLIERALEEDVPLLGICLGSQLLAHALGSTVRPGERPEIGWHAVTLADAAADDPLWRDVESPFTAFHWHGDVFDLPAGAVSLARSARTRHQGFRYGRAAYGFLFHLEVTPDIVAGMTKALRGELAEAGLDGAAIRAGAEAHVPALRRVAGTVFGRWARCIQG